MSKKGPIFNSGVDVLCISDRNLSILRIKRNLQRSLNSKGIYSWFSKKEAGSLFHNKEKVKRLIKLGWITEKKSDHKTLYRFKSETQWLKNNLNKDFKEKKLSISKKLWIYTISREYQIDDIDSFDGDISWAILIDSLLPLTSQQKIANLAGYSREALNSKIKKNEYISITNQHLKVSDDVFNKFKSKEALKSYLSANNLRGYKVSFDGKLYRQLPNKYKINLNVKYLEKTFDRQSRKLNKSLKTSTRIPHAGPLWVKKISLNRSAKRSRKIFPKGSMAKFKGSILSSELIVKKMTGDREGLIKTLPSKIKKEVNRIGYKMDLSSSFNERKNLRVSKIQSGQFFEVNNIEFKKFKFLLGKLQNNTSKGIEYHSMRKTQRRSIGFHKAAVIMCNNR